MKRASGDLTYGSVEAVQQCLNTPELLRDLLHQLLKDFHTAQIPLQLLPEEGYAFDALTDCVQLAMDAHLKTSGSLKNLLNRVDLTEKQVKKFIPDSLHANLRILAELIIKRELQKVVIRHWYRQTSDQDSSTD